MSVRQLSTEEGESTDGGESGEAGLSADSGRGARGVAALEVPLDVVLVEWSTSSGESTETGDGADAAETTETGDTTETTETTDAGDTTDGVEASGSAVSSPITVGAGSTSSDTVVIWIGAGASVPLATSEPSPKAPAATAAVTATIPLVRQVVRCAIGPSLLVGAATQGTGARSVDSGQRPGPS
ncbi:MAG: hypothetical protein JJT89_05845 [Nitriliruptoraceae bacterium]|nr:hypothetical protein [Nitriliruptoraceae bacterium]